MVQHADVHLLACMDGFMHSMCNRIFMEARDFITIVTSLPVLLWYHHVYTCLRVEGVGNFTGLTVHVQNMSTAVLAVSASDGT